nr:hypothetical protein [Tanacetum cinerariifolium]
MSRCDIEIKDVKQITRCDIDIDDETLNRHVVGLKKATTDTGSWQALIGLVLSIEVDMDLHFIWEGADTFYFTGYDEHGSEIGEYNDLMTQQRRSRILATLGNDPGESSAIPPDFVTTNDLFIFEHAKIMYGKKSYRLELHREFYNDDPSRVNYMKLVGNWRILRRCMFGKNKTIRIKYLTDIIKCPPVYTKNHQSGNFTSPPGRIYHWAEIEWFDLDDSETFLINGYDAMLKDLGIKDGSILFSCFRIPRKSLDEGLVPLMSNQDVLSLLQYVHIYKEIKVYIKKKMMEVVLSTGKGVVIKEVMEDDEVKEASETGNSGKQLLSVTENEVQIKTKPSTLPWSFESLSDSDISDHPQWSSKSMNEKRNKRLSEKFQFRKMLFDIDLTFGLDFSHETLEMKNKVKAEQEMEEPVHNDFHPLMYKDDMLQKEDPVKYQQDPYHEEDEPEKNAVLFDKQDHLLEHVPFLKETVVIIDGDAPLLAIDALVVPPVIVLDEQLERPNKRRKLNPA